MSLFIRMVFFGLVGIIAGILSWPCAEVMLFFQARFPSLLLFSIALGVVIGVFIGGCFGTSEGIISISFKKIKSGIVMGIIIGAIGGLFGFVIGQGSLIFIGTTFFNSAMSFKNIGFPISKAIGWAAFGICIGIVEGIRSRSFDKVKHGIIGGLIGGILGGLVFEYLRVFLPQNFIARLCGLIILGLLIGLFYGYIENQLSRASLFLLNGRFKGKEFPLSQKRIRIGSSQKAEIGISGYANLYDVHAEIKREKQAFMLADVGSKIGTFLNDKRVSKAKLQNDSIIRLGSAQFLFRTK
ncbi:hypothetical protein ES703_77003 [subsurface metagenome]